MCVLSLSLPFTSFLPFMPYVYFCTACIGRYDLDDCVLLCEDCKYEAKNELCNLIESGFWPGNVARKSNYLFSFELFNLFDKLHKFMPGSSVNGFVQAIKEISQQRGRVCLYIPY